MLWLVNKTTTLMRLFISSCLFLVLASCNSSQKLSGTTEDYSKTTIVYEETPCFGECPVYTMTLDGATMTATFKGKANTTKIGTYSKAISSDEYSKFMEAIDKANFTKLNNEYMGLAPDFPIRIITLTKDGKTKTVKNRSDAPPELGVLEQVFKHFANTDGWKKTGSADDKAN
jgi:hypothetical protein